MWFKLTVNNKVVPMFLLLTLNILFYTLFYYFYCWLWKGNCLLDLRSYNFRKIYFQYLWGKHYPIGLGKFVRLRLYPYSPSLIAEGSYLFLSDMPLLKFCLYPLAIRKKCSTHPIGKFWGLIFSQDFWNPEKQNLHKILIPMVYNIPYILTDQISGIFKGTWKNKEYWLKNICNSNNGV